MSKLGTIQYLQKEIKIELIALLATFATHFHISLIN